MATAFRAQAFTDFTGTPATVNVSKPAGTVDGDLITVVGEFFWDGTGSASTAGFSLAGWTNVLASGNNAGISVHRLFVLYKTASSEGSSWTFTMDRAVNGFLLAATWDGTKLSAGTPDGTYAASNATTDNTAPYQAGFIPTQINKPPNTWSLIFSYLYDTVSSGGVLSFTNLTNEVLAASHSLNDTGSAYFIGGIYEKFDSKWEADTAGVGMSCNEGPSTFVNGLWIPNFALASATNDAWAWFV